MPLGQLRQLIEQQYGWALRYDFSAADAEHFFWYRSAEKKSRAWAFAQRSQGPKKKCSWVLPAISSSAMARCWSTCNGSLRR